MIGTGFASQIIALAGDGQPHFVAGPVHWAANIIAADPVLWDVPFAAVQALPGQNTGTAVAGALTGGAPGWLGRLVTSIANWTTHHGTTVVLALVVAEALIGLAALHRKSRGPALAAGLVLALAIWVIGQDLGQLYSGQATDPNTAPLIGLMAVALLRGERVRAGRRHADSPRVPVARRPRRQRQLERRTRVLTPFRPN